MSVDRTPPPNLPPPLPLAPVYIEPSVCHVCNGTMNERDDCLIINECSHTFHRSCIEAHLSNSSECPVCKKSCRLCDLRKLVINPKGALRAHTRTKLRGALAHQYNTRSSNKNLLQESNPSEANAQEVLQESVHLNDNMLDPDNIIENALNSPFRNSATNPTQDILTSPNNNASGIDYDQINRLIEANLTKLLQNVHLGPPANNTNLQSNPNPAPSYETPRSNSQPINNNPYILSSSAMSSSNTGTIHVDKISSIIHNWNVKFDGSPNGLHVEEFLYRINSLTQDTFNGDFSVTCRNLHILLVGKARDWYWRYHKQVKTVNWKDFCEALRGQYREFKSSFDIREEVRNRKQRPGETFDIFFDAVLAIMDRLPTPMSDSELIEILARNLRPDIRQDLLYVPIHSISHLRKLVQMREYFLNDESVRKNLLARNPTYSAPRKNISEINSGNANEYTDEVEDVTCSVNAIQGKDPLQKCWNCDEVGHHWENCLKDRTIFCYGCGAKRVYKPNCTYCAEKRKNFSKNYRSMGPSKDSH